MKKNVHIILQGKGGVGKSYISALIAQYHQANDLPVVCMDTDPVNATLTGYKALNARRLDLMDGSTLVERRFDEMMESIVAEDANFVIDNGASSFIPLSNYLVENRAIEVMSEQGKQVVVHTVIAGSQQLLDTLQGFDSLANQLPAGADLVVWLNEFFGDIELDGKSFEDMKVYQRHRERVRALVRIPRQSSSTFGEDVKLMLGLRLTFDEVAKSPEFGLMAKQRLATVKGAIFEQLANVF